MRKEPQMSGATMPLSKSKVYAMSVLQFFQLLLNLRALLRGFWSEPAEVCRSKCWLEEDLHQLQANLCSRKEKKDCTNF
eukprot:Gb_09978 [translate_table: standard]